MIQIQRDLFGGTELMLGHGVNIQGAMGAGIALEFSRRWPDMYEDYLRACRNGELSPGDIHTFDTGERLIVNMVTQRLVGADARLEWIASSARKALQLADEIEEEHVAIPRIGSGIGGLRWRDVQRTLENAERGVSAQFVVCSL